MHSKGPTSKTPAVSTSYRPLPAAAPSFGSPFTTPPGGRLGSLFTRLIGDEPELELAKDLRRLKQLLETGEIATTEGQPAGRAQGKTLLDRMAS